MKDRHVEYLLHFMPAEALMVLSMEDMSKHQSLQV